MLVSIQANASDFLKKGEKVTRLDGSEHILDQDWLMFTLPEGKIIDLKIHDGEVCRANPPPPSTRSHPLVIGGFMISFVAGGALVYFLTK